MVYGVEPKKTSFGIIKTSSELVKYYFTWIWGLLNKNLSWKNYEERYCTVIRFVKDNIKNPVSVKNILFD